MPHADLDESGRSIHVATTYADRQLMLMVPGARFHKPSDGWLVPRSWAACVTLRGLFGEKLTVGPELISWSNQEHTRRIQPALAMRDQLHPSHVERLPAVAEVLDQLHLVETVDAMNPNHLHLYPYQRVDVAFLVINERALLANEPGLGKTGATIRTLQVLARRGEKPFPAVVICPNSLKTTVWQKELEAWAPYLRVSVVDGSAGQRRKALAVEADVYVVNWESVRLHSRLAPYGSIELSDKEREPKELDELGVRTAIFDEVHRATSPQSKQTRAAWQVAHHARFCFALTGTPVTNTVASIWSLLHLVEPDWFPARTRWVDRYVRLAPNFYGGFEVVGLDPATAPELHKIVDPLIRRVPKQLALPQLPPKLPVQYRETPMNPAQKKMYEQMQALMVAQLDEGLVTATNALSKLARLSQFASASAFLDEDDNVHLKAPSNKVDDLVDLLEDMGDAPLVVGAESRQLIELAAEKLTSLGVTHGLVTGAQSVDERRRYVDQFQAGRLRVILCTLGAGAEGLTLTAASDLLFLQESYSQVKNKQFQDRVHRIGQTAEFVRIMVQVTPNTIDARRIEILQGKEAQAQQILHDEATLRKLLGVK